MRLGALLRYLREAAPIPFEVQFGGFQNREYAFRSRGTIPFHRTFSIQGDKAVVMGWPVCWSSTGATSSTLPDLIGESRQYPMILDRLRRRCQEFGVLHGYHRQFTDTDNDFYCRIGLINPSGISSIKLTYLQAQMRLHLSSLDSVIVQITSEDIFIVSYEDETLPLDTSRAYSITDDQLNNEFFRALYE
jgi:hypothetical protein